ncbi:FG-GAP-like repeat-containing protein [Neorhodopirellula pilleata]|uniref:ASPIC and UnbV n=1 Tax=Neorhodopirellula pilleata TaxID=2714738 RepID=A0A5C5ZLV7_9BACT|nr:FG-GAP-like repeat-containing protein [Neorhodopirellula pilleata]TWT87967.1 ASPIC and UnbV [Neorhodopirellula pilleata]
MTGFRQLIRFDFANQYKMCQNVNPMKFGVGVLVICSMLGCRRDSQDVLQDDQRPPAVYQSEAKTLESVQPESKSENRAVAEVGSTFQLQRLASLVTAGKLDEARDYLRPQLIDQPNNYELLFWAARIEDADGRTDGAVEILKEIPEHDPRLGLIAIGHSADLLTKLGRFDEAIDRYERIVEAEPQMAVAHRQLAFLYNRLGNRQSAIQHLQVLLRLGDITEQELASLLCLRDASYTQPLSTTDLAALDRNAQSIGLLGRARELATGNDLRAAYRLLRQEIVERINASATKAESPVILDPATIALLGRLVVELQDPEGIAFWCSLVEDHQERFAEHWFALGMWSFVVGGNENPQATAAMLGQCLLLDPTDWVAHGLLQNVMNQLKESKREQSFQDRATWIKRSILASNEISEKGILSTDAIVRLSESLVQLDRPLEANAWQMIAISSRIEANQSQETVEAVNDLKTTHQNLVALDKGFAQPSEILCGMPMPSDLSRIRDDILTKIKQKHDVNEINIRQSSDPARRQQSVESGKWRMRQEEVGLHFRYRNSEPVRDLDFQLYEQFGGGVGVLDYDRDGSIDLYFAQSAGAPLENSGVFPNQFFAQIQGRFADVTMSSGVGDRGYGLGVAVGDINQDGFDDILVANFGRNVLFINQGDGTFIEPALAKVWEAKFWTSSMAVADLDGDGLPDVFEVNYIDDERVHERPTTGPNGRLSYFPGPEDFRPAKDRLLIQSDDGKWIESNLSDESASAPGLGILVGNVDSRTNHNEIFIANDTRPNSFWQFQDGTWKDLAKLKGCAYSARGGSGASMGIAAADFDNNGQLDLHVTNFLNEPVHLYMQDDQGVFVDKVVPGGLYGDSMGVLGFGTVAADTDNDGDADLVTLNGHIEDLRFRNAPFRMRPQFFLNQDGRFRLADVNNSFSSDHFFNQESVGRGLVKTDWNRDGRIDLIATHLDQPANLIENETDSLGHWIQLEFVGTHSERSAIGTIVAIETSIGESKQWLTSGGGYSCSDERIIHVGLGEVNRIDSVNVQWPSGSRQSFNIARINCRVMLIEGEAQPYVLSP